MLILLKASASCFKSLKDEYYFETSSLAADAVRRCFLWSTAGDGASQLCRKPAGLLPLASKLLGQRDCSIEIMW